MLSPCSNIQKLESKKLFVFALRLYFGIWILYLGLTKWINGASGFVEYITNTFQNTWAPELLLSLSAWAILFAEVAIGLWLLSGKKQRLAWLAAADLMFLLAFGQSMLKEWATVSNNWQYVVLCLAAACLIEPENESIASSD